MPAARLAQLEAFRPAGFFALRTAALPFETITDWAAGMMASDAVHASAPTLDVALASDRKELCRRLDEILAGRDIQESLFIASPSTHEDHQRRLATQRPLDVRLQQTLARYLERMAGRATPFGLFARCSVGRVAGITDLRLGSTQKSRRHTRLDHEYLFALGQSLQARPDIRDVIPFTPNSSLYHLAGRWRYVRSNVEGGGRTQHLVALDSDDYLDAAIQRAQSGATLSEIAQHLLTIGPEAAISPDDATQYVIELADQQVLVSELTPLLTGTDALDDLIQRLRGVGSAQSTVETLESVRAELQAIDSAGIGVDPARYMQAGRVLDTLGVRADPSRLFQVDLTAETPAATLGVDVVAQLEATVQALYGMECPPPGDQFKVFREAFLGRYERRDVPLVEVLDEESGIGFRPSSAPGAENAPLLDGIPLGAAAEGASPSWTSKEVFLFRRLEEVLRDGGSELALSATDLERLKSPPEGRLPLPDAFSVVAALAVSSQDTGPNLYFRGMFGPSGANLLGRFCRAGPELEHNVRGLLNAEEALRPEAVFAEIVHLPEGRMGNVIARPVLRDYEIAYLGRSGAPIGKQIPISDLTVTVDASQRVVLRSMRLGCEVVPRMCNAHSVSRGQGVYRFLGALQTQGVTAALAWNWGPLEAASFLPRVTIGRVLLSRARWRLGTQDLSAFAAAPFERGFRALQNWRERRKVPRFIALVDVDNELLIDLDNVLSIEAFLAIAGKRESAIVVEVFPCHSELAAYGPEGRHIHEVIVPFVRASPPSSTATSPSSAVASPRIRRRFEPGAEWTYLKWYTGTSTADSLLSTTIPRLVDRLERTGAIDRWFFVRYGDPDWHIRLRLHSAGEGPAQVLAAVATAGAGPLADGRLWRVQVDTYEREIERYGGDVGLLACEEYFWRDSEAVIAVLQLLTGDDGMAARWQLCLRSWDLMLSEFGFSLTEKLRLAMESRQGLLHTVGTSKALERALGDKFRIERRSIERLFDPAARDSHPLAAALDVLERRSEAVGPLAGTLRNVARGGAVREIAASLLHMHANRILRSAHRPQELVLYDFLGRIYQSQVALAGSREPAVAGACTRR